MASLTLTPAAASRSAEATNSAASPTTCRASQSSHCRSRCDDVLQRARDHGPGGFAVPAAADGARHRQRPPGSHRADADPHLPRLPVLDGEDGEVDILRQRRQGQDHFGVVDAHARRRQPVGGGDEQRGVADDPPREPELALQVEVRRRRAAAHDLRDARQVRAGVRQAAEAAEHPLVHPRHAQIERVGADAEGEPRRRLRRQRQRDAQRLRQIVPALDDQVAGAGGPRIKDHHVRRRRRVVVVIHDHRQRRRRFQRRAAAHGVPGVDQRHALAVQRRVGAGLIRRSAERGVQRRKPARRGAPQIGARLPAAGADRRDQPERGPDGVAVGALVGQDGDHGVPSAP